MSVLAYSELLRRIAGIEQDDLERPFKILSRNNATRKRIEILKILASAEPISIGMLLQKSGLPRGGGSYMTIKRFFLALEKEGLLEHNIVRKRALWQYSASAELFKRYILR